MTPTKPTRTRVTIKLKRPNSLFELWLTEWRDKAKESNSKMQHCFSIALRSLKKYPLPLESGKDCKLLQGFGNKLCQMLDEKLKDYRNKNPAVDLNTIPPIQPNTDTTKPTPKKKKSATTDKQLNQSRGGEYIPQHGSGAYAILVTLYERSLDLQYPGHLTKAEIIKYGKHLSNTSFTKPDPGSRYTAWSSMRTLLFKKLISKQGNPAKFSLTNIGTAKARKLYEVHKGNVVDNSDGELNKIEASLANKNARLDGVSMQFQDDLHFGQPSSGNNNNGQSLIKQVSSECTSLLPRQNSGVESVASDETIILAPNSFDIVLFVDTQETSGSKIKADDDALLSKLQHLNVVYETRNLKVGDYTWICRDKISKLELVLPYIIERKRMDDFGSSIKDGRFHEQKFRLKQSGLQNLIYLIESYGNNDQHLGLPLTTLYQAATNTLVQGGFTVKFTNNLQGTAEYLACMTTLLRNNYESKTVVCCPRENATSVSIHDDLIYLMKFTEFNKNASKIKHFKVKELFTRQLLQIKGMSVEKALAIVEKYNTPKHLKLAYESLAESLREKLLSTLQYGEMKKNVGPTLSKIVCQFFCNKTFAFVD